MRDRLVVGRGVLPWLLTAALAALAGCTADRAGDAGPTQSDDAPHRPDARTAAALRAVETATVRAGSARITSATVMGAMLSTRTEGTLDWAGDSTGTLRITYTGGELATTMRRLGTTTMEARLLPDAYYAQVGTRFARQMGGRHWIRYDYEDLDALPGDSGRYLKDQLRNTAPIPPVRLLLASGNVRAAGEETVDGVRTRHYSGTVEVAALTDRALREQLTAAGVTGETLDIWVDDRDLLVKKVEEARMSTGLMTQTAHYRDYGVRLSVRRPPAADTRDFEDLVKQQSSTP
ncbi:hypothetical protein FNH09_16575 [Streptomyces adustus]|uniref:LppX_LprAFG lipoprotein n=1 Tax=Streptomyces adustus TaxID=1609272 RepID=A0A5N8VC43_9ACTN|nr:hypothetical protein [Streptomyces adustus]MPY32821.1 hypothetical protein [Streptomyces adustus]